MFCNSVVVMVDLFYEYIKVIDMYILNWLKWLIKCCILFGLNFILNK